MPAPLAGAIAAGVTILVVLYLTGFFYYLAEPVIAALIIVAVFKMVDIPGLSRIGHINKNEIYIAVITLAGVLFFGILAGVLIGTFLSLIEILYRVSFPHMAVLGRIPDTDTFGDISRHPENEVVEGIFIFRIDAPLIFANAESFKDNILNALGREKRPIHVVILDFESSPFTDVTAVDMTRDLISELEHKGIKLRIANASGQTRDILRRAGIEEKVGRLDQATTIAAIIRQSRDSHLG
jgi:SulP family sulfate permease